MSVHYTPSELVPGETEFLRERSFTRWMSRELPQASVDFNCNIGLFPLYAECAGPDKFRYLFWR